MVKKILKENGKGKVLVVDGGGSLRRALVGDMVAMDFMKNDWEGIIGKFYFLFILFLKLIILLKILELSMNLILA